MEKSSASPNDSFTSAMTLTEEGLTNVPKRYILPASLRPDGTLSNTCHPLHRPRIIEKVHLACKKLGFFQVLLSCHVTCNHVLK